MSSSVRNWLREFRRNSHPDVLKSDRMRRNAAWRARKRWHREHRTK